jgi:ferrous iron transport protein B
MSSTTANPIDHATPAPASPARPHTIALAGNPNSGKTTIFNALTGLRQKVANYPGVTVEKKTGRCKLPAHDGQVERWVDVIDLPGTYSLISRSPDEHIAMEVLRGLRPDTPAPDVVVVVVDASNLQRNLYLVSQLIELGRPMVVALNMTDIAERRGLRVSAETLSRELGVPVVPVVGHKGKGIEDLKAAVDRAAVAPMPNWPLPDVVREELLLVGGGLAILHSESNGADSPVAATPASPSHGNGDSFEAFGDSHQLREATQASRLQKYQAIAERLLIGDRAADMAAYADREPIASLLRHATSRLQQLGIDPMQADVEAHYHWIEAVSNRAVSHVEVPTAPATLTVSGRPLDYATPQKKHLTQKLDAILIHKVWGLFIFAGVMAALFVAVFWVAAPMMDAMEGAVAWLGENTAGRLGEGPLRDMLLDGVFAGVGGVVVFVPQIAMLFLFLAILEDSGYLARAAFLMDRVLSKVGLHGKSFIPLLSSFACAIPGVMATRTIENRKDRLATIFVAPFMSCSARLPVYFLLISLFFAQYTAVAQGLILFSLYALGVVAAAVTAWFFKRSFLKGPTPAFILELPTYKLPQLSQVARQVWFNTKAFLVKAGTTIFCLSVILWALAYYPRLPEARQAQIRQEQLAQLFTPPAAANAELTTEVFRTPSSDLEAQINNAVASEQLRQSFAGRFGHLVEPLIRPLGYDWKMGVGLVGAFAAREVFVSTMAIVYNAGSEDETADLESAMLADTRPDGSPVWTPLVGVSLLIWFVLAMQCISTLAIVRRETGGWRWPIAMLLYMNGLAYVICLIVYQVGRAFMA